MLATSGAGRGARKGSQGAAVLALLLVAGIGSGCGPGGTSATSRHADQEFLSAVHAGAPDIGGYRSDSQLVHLGHAACDGFDAGVSYEQLADRLALSQGTHSLPSQDLGVVIDSAVSAYCPRFRSRVS